MAIFMGPAAKSMDSLAMLTEKSNELMTMAKSADISRAKYAAVAGVALLGVVVLLRRRRAAPPPPPPPSPSPPPPPTIEEILPLAMVCDIARRLPAYEVFRLGRLVPIWGNVLSSPEFVRQFYTSTSQNQEMIIYTSGRLLRPQQLRELHGSCVTVFGKLKRIVDVTTSAIVVEDVAGILLVYIEEGEGIVLFNPVTNLRFFLPGLGADHAAHVTVAIGFTYDNVFKVVKVVGSDGVLSAHVIDFPNATWRTLDVVVPPNIVSRCGGVSIGSSYYWLTYGGQEAANNSVVRFDSVNDRFSVIPLPSMTHKFTNQNIISFDGLLALGGCLLQDEDDEEFLTIWLYQPDGTWIILETFNVVRYPIQTIAYKKSIWVVYDFGVGSYAHNVSNLQAPQIPMPSVIRSRVMMCQKYFRFIHLHSDSLFRFP